jgi:hypothetical protein
MTDRERRTLEAFREAAEGFLSATPKVWDYLDVRDAMQSCLAMYAALPQHDVVASPAYPEGESWRVSD